MSTPLKNKSTVEEIEKRFDMDVERFSDLETGQTATIDAPLAMELITQAAIRSTANIQRVLDIGCGAGNNTLKLLLNAGQFDCDLVDLSKPMLDRACQRIASVSSGRIRAFQCDFRTAELPERSYDVILAAAVLHHLRDDQDWQDAFKKFYSLTAPGGSIWITDLVAQESQPIQALMWDRYGRYLATVGGSDYKDKIFSYIDREDSPRAVTYQMDLLRTVGFSKIELLHKNACFAAFGAIKAC
jgi:tRNA (cmo5U34)-methyltransferase